MNKFEWRPGQPWRKSAPTPARQPAPQPVPWTERDTWVTWALGGFVWFAAWIGAGAYFGFNPFPIMIVIHLAASIVFLILATINIGRIGSGR